MKMYFVIGALLLVLLCSCGPRGYYDCDETQAIFKIIQKSNRKLARLGLYQVMNGGGGQPLVTYISEGYRTNRYLFTSVDEARPFFCGIIKEFLESLNADTSIAPLMQNFPLTYDNIQIWINFRDEQWNFYQSPVVSTVYLLRGRIFYVAYDENEKMIKLHNETPEEAFKLCR